MNLSHTISSITKSPDFRVDLNIEPSASHDLIKQCEIIFKKKMSAKLPEDFMRFMLEHNGVRFRWTYNKLTHPDYLTAGAIEIYGVEKVIAQIEHGHEYIVFDWMDDINHTAIAVKNNSAQLYYFDLYEEKYFKMSISLSAYMEMVLLTKGLYPWQLFFVDQEKEDKGVLQKKFFVDLLLICTDEEIQKIKETIIKHSDYRLV
jgi:hypothetical protein